MTDNTKSLVEQASRGDAAAIDELLERHMGGLLAFVRLRAGRLLRAKESGSDIAQSVCREILEHMDRYQYGSEAGFRQWLYTTALRKIKNRYEYYRAAKRDAGLEVPLVHHGSPTDDQSEQILDAYRSFCSPSRAAMARENLAAVEGAFDALTEEAREVIVLAKIIGLSRAEIAEQMGKSEGAVRTLLHRALATLADQVALQDE